MAIRWLPRRTATAAKVPTTADLVDGEIGVNTTDKKIFIRVGAAIVELFKSLTKADVDGLWGGDPTGGPILTLGAITGGSGYVSGTYSNVALTDSNPGASGARADITVTAGAVTAVTLVDTGGGYNVGDVLSATAVSLGGTGSGFSVPVATVRSVDLALVNTAPRIRMTSSDTSLTAGQEIASLLFGTRDTSANGRGDNVRIVANAESTSAGGYLDFWTTPNAGQPHISMSLRGNGDLRFYNPAGTFYHTLVNNPTAARTLTLPDGNTVLTAGTMVPTTGTGATGTWGISITGSAATLTTARTINGTSFNGSANITTANWGTARNFTIGATTRGVNGAADVSWTLADMGAAALTGASFTGSVSTTGNLSSSQNFISTSTVAVLAATGTGQVLLRPNGSGSTTGQMTIDSSGNMSAASINCGYAPNLGGSVGASNWFRSNGNTGWYNADYVGGIYMTDTTYVRAYNGKSFYATDCVSSSDARLKKNIKPFAEQRRYLLSDNAVRYEWIADGRHDIGFIAQTILPVYPELVDEVANGATVDADGNEVFDNGTHYVLNYQKCVAVLAGELKSAREEIDELRERLARLEARL